MSPARWRQAVCAVLTLSLSACAPATEEQSDDAPAADAPVEARAVPEAQFTLSDVDTHTKFSSAIPPALRVPSGAVVEVFTHEATGGQLNVDSTPEDMANVDMDRVHTLTGPIHVEGALLSIGDTHAAQGDGEVCGTAIEAPMRVVLEVNVRKGGRSIPEPEYETDEYYATTGFAETTDEAARKATRHMLDYLVAERGLTRGDAYALASLVGDLKINEVVDVPHVLVSMHVPKSIFR